jgi:hypothetical protein
MEGALNTIKIKEIYNLSNCPMKLFKYIDVYTSKTEKSKLETLDDYIFYVLNDSTIELLDYKGNASSITLPNRYKGKKYKLANYAFYGKDVENVTIPGGVTEIGKGVFAECKALKNVVMQEGVTEIGLFTFQECSALSTVTIPNSVKNIEVGVFDRCVGLTNIIVGKGNLEYSSLNGVLFDKKKTMLILYPKAKKGAYKIPNGVTSIESEAFKQSSGLTSVTIPGSLKRIEAGAFGACFGLKSVTILEGVEVIDYKAFYGCVELASVTIPNSVSVIGSSAFEYCKSLKNITIPNGTSIRDGAFAGCRGLKSITVKSFNPPKITWSAFENVDKSTPLYVPEQSVERYKNAEYWDWFTNIQGKPLGKEPVKEKDEEEDEVMIMSIDDY